MPTAENPLRFLHISDTHINPDRTYNRDYAAQTPMLGAEALLKTINSLPFVPDFILHTGDLAHDPIPEVYPFIKEFFADLPCPIYYLAGNHDDAASIQRVLMGRDEVSRYLYYDFEEKGVHIVCLDSNGEDHNPEHPSGYVTEAQLDWLDAICASDDERPLVVAIHHNTLPVQVPWLDTWMRTENAEALHEVLRQARDRLCGVFSGHIHHNYQVLRDGVMYISAASSWGQLGSVPDPSNTMYLVQKEAEASLNIVTITDTTTSIGRFPILASQL